MSFIGNVPAEAYSPVAKDTFSGNDSTTDFTLSIPATTNSVEVFVENVQQEPTTAYTISGTTLSFTAAPVSGTNNIYVIHRGPAVQTVVPPAGVALNPSDVTATGNLSVTGTTTLTDDLNVDSGTLFVDASANAVGIGTASPTQLLTLENGDLLIHETGSSDPLITLSVGGTQASPTQSWLLRVDNSDSDKFQIRNATGGSTVLSADTSGNLQFNSGYGSVATAYGCRAWVNFDGTTNVSGNCTIRASGNVSSVVDNGTANYGVIFATAMPNTSYAAVATCGLDSGGSRSFCSTEYHTTTTIDVLLRRFDGSSADAADVQVAVFR